MVGGIAAWNASSTVKNCFAAGSIWAENINSLIYCGGIVGSGEGEVYNCAALLDTVTLNGTTHYSSRVITDAICPYSKLKNNIVLNSLTAVLPNASAKEISAAAAADQSTYTDIGWDFNKVWVMDQLPRLSLKHTEHIFIKGYNFNEDSFNFTNYGSSISLDYFTTIYDTEPGKLLFKEKQNSAKGGLCFGMAVATANIYNNCPSCSAISTKDGQFGSFVSCSCIRDIMNYVWINYGTDYYDPGLTSVKSYMNFNGNVMSIEDFIKYCHVYQWSNECLEKPPMFSVDDYLSSDSLGMIICFSQTDNGGHAVLVIGASDKEFIVDDPNDRSKYHIISFYDDGSWTYDCTWGKGTKVNSENTTLGYLYNCGFVYDCLTSATHATIMEGVLPDDGEDLNGAPIEVQETYFACTKRLSQGCTLCYIDSEDYSLVNESITDVTGNISDETSNEQEESGILFWLNESNTVSFKDIKGHDNSIAAARKDTLARVEIDDASELMLSLEDQAAVDVQTNQNASLTVSLSSSESDTEVSVTLACTTESGHVNLEQANDGIKISGADSGMITLSYDDTVIREIPVPDSESSFSIRYHSDASSDDFDVISDLSPEEDISDDQNASEAEDICSICGITHGSSFWERVVYYFHRILYFFAHLFGLI